MNDHHRPCACGAELEDECTRCARTNPLGSMRVTTYGMCTHCGSVEVALNGVSGYRDLSYMGESARYPIGYGCEVCS